MDFHGKMEKEVVFKVKRIEQDVREDIDWLNNISLEQKERLETFLLNLDRSHRVDLTSARSKTIIQGVNQIMNTICQKIAERKSCFSGDLVTMGSSHNDTKIGKTDEFDFVYEMDGNNLMLNGKDDFIVFHGPFDGTGEIVVELEETSDFCLPINITPENSLLGHLTSDNPDGCKLMNTKLIQETFRDILKDVLAESELPLDWYHGGFNKPNFSGLRESGPAFLLQFDYLKTNQEDHLSLSIDFVPMITVDVCRTDSFLRNILTDFPWPEYSWLSLTKWLIYFGHGEEEWLAQYSADSMPKTLIRICKALHGLVQLSSPKCVHPHEAELMVHYIKQKKQGDSTKAADLPDFVILGSTGFASFEYDGTDDYASYSDIGEVIGNDCMVKSYCIKKLAMAMMAVDKSHGHDWTQDDLPDLVMSFYMLLSDVVINLLKRELESTDAFCGMQVVEKEFSVSLEKMFLSTDTVRSTPPQTGKLSPKEMSKVADLKCQTPQLTGTLSPEEMSQATDPKWSKLQLTGRPLTEEISQATDLKCPKPPLTGKRSPEELSQATDLKCPTSHLTGKPSTEEMFHPTDLKCPTSHLTRKPSTEEMFQLTDPKSPKPQLTGKPPTEEISQATDLKCTTPPLIGKSPTVVMSQETDTNYRKKPLEGKPISKHKLKAPTFVTVVETAIDIDKLEIITTSNPVYLSGLAAIFRVFRCVCEGKKTANIVSLKLDQSCIDSPRYPDLCTLTKGELEEMSRAENIVPGFY